MFFILDMGEFTFQCTDGNRTFEIEQFIGEDTREGSRGDIVFNHFYIDPVESKRRTRSRGTRAAAGGTRKK